MAKEKKPLTTKQKKTRYRIFEYLTFGGEFVSLITPFVIMGIVNKDEWFIENTSAWKIGLGGTLALTLMSIALFLVSKKKADEKMSDSYIALIIGWFAFAFIFTLLADIMNQIANIMWFGGLGLLGAFGLNIVSKNLSKKADRCNKLIQTANDKLDEEQVIEEVQQEREEKEKKKVKIKIKKGE